MKEMDKPTLTSPGQTLYSEGGPRFNRGGEIFMEGKPDMKPQNSQPTNPEHAETVFVPKPQIRGGLTPEAFKAGWQKYLQVRGERGIIPFGEMQTLRMMRESGIPPIGGGAPTPEEEAAVVGGGTREGGERVPTDGEIEKKRLDLASRGRDLDRQMDRVGTRVDSNGNLTPDAAREMAKLVAERDDINRQAAEIFVTQERTRKERPPSEEGILVNEADKYVAELLSKGREGGALEIGQINDLTKLSEPEKKKRRELVHGIKEFLKGNFAIDTAQFPSHILPAVRHFTELREELISEILFKSFEDISETNEYELGLYAASNLDVLLGFLRQDDNSRYKKLFSLRTAAHFFQLMNKTVIIGKFDHFGDAAENINYRHFEDMRDITGSGLAMRLYEQAYKDCLAKNQRVTQNDINIIQDFVETTFRENNEALLIKSKYSQYRTTSKLEDWEVQRAMAAGRTFFNITLRAAENIATGQVPHDRRRYTSPPQEDMVRILNWNQWLLGRFTVGGGKEGRHGEEFLKMSTDRWEEYLRFKGAKLGICGIAEFGGVDVRKMEEGGQYRTSGIYSGWRLEDMAFDEIAFNYNGKRFTVQEFRDQFKDKDGKDIGVIKDIKDRIEQRKTANPDNDPKNFVTQKDQEDYRNVFMPVVNNLDFGLSMLLKNGDFGAQDNKLGYLLRVEIWKKIANTNTPLMIDYLTGIKYDWGEKLTDIDKELKNLRLKKNKPKEDEQREKRLKEQRDEILVSKAMAEKAGSIARSLGELRANMGPEWAESGQKWSDFKRKILTKHERMIQEGIGEELPEIEGNELDAEETRMEDAIKAEGVKLAPHLADIVFAYTPFMNDMPFEKFDYRKLGQTFYKRRSTSDLGGFNKGQSAFNSILDNPGGITAENAIKAMGEIVSGIAGPEGPRPAMEANLPTFTALLDIMMADKGITHQAMLKMFLEAIHQETSIAQRWGGITAGSFTEAEAANMIDKAIAAGILNPELGRYLKKKKRVALSGILWMLIRDVFIPLVPVWVAGELVTSVKKGDGRG